MFTKIAQILTITLLSATFLQAGTISPSVPDDKYLAYAEKFQCIVKISGTDAKGEKFGASAVILDKHHILTAAHVVEGAKLVTIHLRATSYPLEEVIIHKDFSSNVFGIADIALGYSKKELVIDKYPIFYTNKNEVGKICSIGGYGFTGDLKQGVSKYDGKKRAGTNTINLIDKDLLICSASYPSNRSTSLEFIIASGDSGGGLFIDGKLAGINSVIMCDAGTPRSKYGDYSGHTRISKFVEWINANKKKLD